MAQKRSRAAFESDNSQIFYGTPLPPNDPDVRDDGTYVPIWKQEAPSKRFHGAFTGGFNAGYFNTVGSKEGWTPTAFVSSRSNRAKDQKSVQQLRPEDFMDEEDLADLAESKKISVNDAFSGLGATKAGLRVSNSVGIRLLRKMGWNQSQPIGPGIVLDQSTSRPASKNTLVSLFTRKTDTKGIGYGGETRDDNQLLIQSKQKFNETPKPKKSAFGVGVLNDTGSDDEDPYAMGPKISYNRSIGPVKKVKKQKPGGLLSSSNPSLTNKPVFLSKKKAGENQTKCHDGRLPLEGFVLASAPLNLSLTEDYAPSVVPEGWKSSKLPQSDASVTKYQSTADAARASALSVASRAEMLGETPLPGKSVFDFLTSAARDKLVAATKNPNLPAAGNEPTPERFRTDDIKSKIPALDPFVARSALSRVDFMPYAEDLPKRSRYRKYLEYVATDSPQALPPRPDNQSTDEWTTELREFAQAATVFKPMTGMMASRFTSSSSKVDSSSKQEDPAEQAARMGMFGMMTRTVTNFAPTRLVCKRFGVKPPDFDLAPDEQDFKEPVKEPVSEAAMEQIKLELIGRGTLVQNRAPTAVVDREENAALEGQRPGDDVFKAIFGSDDEDED